MRQLSFFISTVLLTSCSGSEIAKLEEENAKLREQMTHVEKATLKACSASQEQLADLLEQLTYETKRADTYYERLRDCE